VLKLSNKISKLSAYFVLLGYLTITTANVFHKHNIDLDKSLSSVISSDKKLINHLNLLGSEVLCVVQFAYNSLHNSFVSFDNPTQDWQSKPDVIYLSLVSPKYLKVKTLNYSLRAPPQFS
jgi:hypothetical protein